MTANIISIIFITLIAIGCAISDYRNKIVPNLLVLLMIIFGVIRHIFNQDYQVLQVATIILFSVLFYSFWIAGWWGAGDAKFCIAMIVCFPYPSLAVTALGIKYLLAYIYRNKMVGKRFPAVTYIVPGYLIWLAVYIFFPITF